MPKFEAARLEGGPAEFCRWLCPAWNACKNNTSLAVARQMAARRADVSFLMVGHGPEETALRAKVRALALADRVRLAGFRPDGRSGRPAN